MNSGILIQFRKVEDDIKSSEISKIEYNFMGKNYRKHEIWVTVEETI